MSKGNISLTNLGHNIISNYCMILTINICNSKSQRHRFNYCMHNVVIRIGGENTVSLDKFN